MSKSHFNRKLVILISLLFLSLITTFAAPTITSFTPSTGPVGTLVTITGTNLSSPTAFTMGGVTAIIVTNDGTSLVGMVMPGATTGTVVVTTIEGTATSAGNFTVTATPFPGTQQGVKLVDNGGVAANQGFSISLSADGNTAIVGGYSDNAGQGAAWIYTRSGGVWAQQGSKLVGTGNTGAAYQGSSVSLSADGNTAIVGGYYDDNKIGAAWVYTRSGSNWTQEGSKLVGTGFVGSPRQGFSVSLSADGNTAIVGGYYDNTYRGAAWVYTRSGGVWTQQGSKLVGTGYVGGSYQGYSVSLSADGNTAIMGGCFDDSGKGAAWVYTRSGSNWTQEGSKLVGSVGSSNASQGISVSLSADGNTAIVGGYYDNAGQGAVWVYVRSAGVWTQQGSKLVGTGNTGAAWQGYSVSLSADGNTAIVGGYADNTNQGAAWVYTRSAGTWTQRGNKLVGTGNTGAAYQGSSIALSADGSTAIVGGYFDNSQRGAAWVFVPLVAPTVTTQTASSVTTAGATLNGTINANNASTTVTFEYGLTTDYGTSVTAAESPVTGSSATSVSKAITGLTPNTTYHYRVKGANAGGTTNGLDGSFTTTAASSSTFQVAGNWSLASNWSAGLPDATTDVIIAANCNVDGSSTVKSIIVNAGKQLTIGSVTLAVNGSFTLKSNATNGTATILNSGTLTVGGTTSVEQYLAAKTGASTTDNWWYISSPVNGATSAIFNPASIASDKNLFGYYNEPTFTYPQITTNDVILTAGKGYVVKLGGAAGSSATYSFTGTLNNDAISVSVSRTGASEGKRGFNLVGNPYPSYLNWNTLRTASNTAASNTNVRPAIWYRTRTSGGAMTFDTYDGSIGTDNGVNGMVNQYIPPMQAFWMKVDADNTTATLTVANNQRSHQDQSNSTNRLRAAEIAITQIVRLKVSNGINSDAAILIADPNASDDFDNYDAQKMVLGDVNIPEIFTLAGSEELVINHLNSISANKECILGFRPGKTGNFTIEATEISNLDNNLKVMLLDKLTNIQQEIKVGSAYSFSSDVTASNNRFRILFKASSSTSGLDNPSSNGDVMVYRNKANHVTVVCNANVNEKSLVSVYNALGQRLINQKLTGKVTEINNTFMPGIYIVTVNNRGQSLTKRIIIN